MDFAKTGSVFQARRVAERQPMLLVPPVESTAPGKKKRSHTIAIGSRRLGNPPCGGTFVARIPVLRLATSPQVAPSPAGVLDWLLGAT